MLTLGKLQIDSPFVQAALSGYSDLAMRRIARRLGAAYTLNEVVLDRLVTQKGKTRRRTLRVEADDHPVGGQLMGALPEQFAEAAADMVEAGYDVIDINFGCPVRKVLGRCRGGYHLSQPDVAVEIIRRVYDAVGGRLPVTVKMRRGINGTSEAERDFFAILDGAFEIGVAGITVHGRTVEQRYVGPANWDFLARVKKHAGDSVILGSGDLFSAEACLRMIERTGVDGVTIARGAIGNPWIFAECRSLAASGKLPPPPSVPEQGRVIAEHFDEAIKVHGASLAGKIMRKFGIKYSEHHPSARQVRDAFIAVRQPDQFQGVISRWYDPQVEWPPVQRRQGHGDLVAAGAE